MTAQAKKAQDHKKLYRPSLLVPVYEYDEDVVMPTSASYRAKTKDLLTVKVTIHNISGNGAEGAIHTPDGTCHQPIGLDPGQSVTVDTLRIDPEGNPQ